MRPILHFRRQLQGLKPALTGAGILLLIQALVTVLMPLPLLVLVDGVLARLNVAVRITPLWDYIKSQDLGMTDNGILLAAAGTLVLLTIVSSILEFAERVKLTRVSYLVIERLREELLGLLMTRKLSYLDRKRKSDLVARVSTDAGQLESIVMSGMLTVARSLPTLLFFAVVLFALNPLLTLLVLISMPVPYWLSLLLSRQTRINLTRVRSETQHFEHETSRILSASATIKSLALEPFVLRSLHERLEEIGRQILNLRRSDGALSAILTGSRHLLRAVILILGGYLILDGRLSLGELTVFLMAIGPLSRAAVSCAQFVTDLGRAETSLVRIEALFGELEGQDEVQGSQAFISLPFPDATTLHFEDVSFAHADSHYLLNEFSESFHAGELIALVGPSGSGRTTFGRLLNRLVEPVAGKIMLGRTDLSRYRLEVLRSYVTVVEHEPYFAQASVRENLRLGQDASTTSEQAISQALHSANAYDFVQGLPDGLDTVIGEGGYQLSSSQLRRLNLARAFMPDSVQIFVFDEPTTGLDPDTITSVVTAIHELAERGAMVFWITNRLDEIPQADRVLLFTRTGNPRVGTHQELLATEATYKSYFTPVTTRAPKPPREI